jgi:hypothetical protein
MVNKEAPCDLLCQLVALARGWSLSLAIGRRLKPHIDNAIHPSTLTLTVYTSDIPKGSSNHDILLHVHSLRHRIHSVQLGHSLSFVWYILLFSRSQMLTFSV